MSIYSTYKASLSPTAWWRFGDASGTVAAEVSGTYAGTYVGSPTLAVAGAIAGDTDTAVTVAGATKYAQFGPLSAIFDGRGPGLSLEAWIKPTTTTGDQAIFGRWSSTPTLQSAYFGIQGDKVIVAVRLASPETYLVGSTASGLIVAGTWQHVVMVWDSSTTIKVYVNGVSKSVTFSPSGPVTALPAYANNAEIGRASASNYFTGNIDEVGVWTRTLTAAEVLALYNAGITAGVPHVYAAVIQQQMRRAG